MTFQHTLLFVPLILIACGGGEPSAKAPPASPSTTADDAYVPPSLAEGQQASMKEDAQALRTAQTTLEDALAKSDCKAKCDAFNGVGEATKHLCYTALTDDDQRQCKEAKDQLAADRERAEKSCEACPPPPEKKRHRRKAK